MAQNKVATLSTIAFYKIVKESWNRSGVKEKLSYVGNTSHQNIDEERPSAVMISYFSTLQNVTSKVFRIDCLPKNLLIKLANCIQNFDGIMTKFVIFLISGLTTKTRENVIEAINSIVVDEYGIINKQKTILNIALEGKVMSYFKPGFTAFHCVDLDMANKEWEKRMELGLKTVERSDLEKSFGDPLPYWEQKNRYGEFNEKFLQCVAIHGGKEALEYFLNKTDISERSKELSRAASHVLNHMVDADKVLFFYQNMEKNVWIEILRRNFFKIFREFYLHDRYRHMCVLFYEQIKDRVGFRVVERVLLFLIDEAISHAYQIPYKTQVKMEQVEPIFLSIFRVIPLEKKSKITKHILIFINCLYEKGRISLIRGILNDDIFSKSEKDDLVYVVVMKFLLQSRVEDIAYFLEMFNGEYSLESVAENYFTVKNFKTFIAFGDNCKNTQYYDQILKLRFGSMDESKGVMQEILNDRAFIEQLIGAIKDGLIEVRDLESLLTWLYSLNSVCFHNYVQKFLYPENLMAEIYKNYMISSKKNFYSIDALYLSDEQLRHIRKHIASDKITLFRYCSMLLKTKDFEALPRMLTCVFQSDVEREIFLREFFASPHGIHSIYCLLIQDAFDDNFFCRFQFKNKLEMYIKFKRYWIRTDAIAQDLDAMLIAYGVPDLEMYRRIIAAENFELLPHESEEDFKLVCDANYTLFKCLLRHNAVVEFMNRIILW